MAEPTKRKLAAILFADIAGYTALMEQDEAGAASMLHRFQKETEEKVTSHGGQVVNFYGDGALCVFPAPLEAVQCGMDLQQAFGQTPAIPVRIGIHSGTVVFEQGKVYGESVNLASRIESLGVPGGVFFSKKVRDEIKNRPDVKTAFLGKFAFKNVGEETEVFALANEGFTVPKNWPPASGHSKAQLVSGHRKKLAPLALAGVLLLALAATWLFFSKNDRKELGDSLRQKKLAVMIFENLTGKDDLDAVGKMASDWVAQGLMQIEDITVITPSTVRDLAVQSGSDVRAYLAKNNAVDYVFDGNYYLDDNQLILKTRVVNAGTGEVEYYLPDYSSGIEQPLDAIRELTERIMGYWLNKQQIERHKTLPPKYEAYKAFLKGMEYYEIDNGAFRNYMEIALSLDTNYFEPYLFLAYSYYYNNYFVARRAEQANAIIRALYDRKIALTPYQEALIKAAEAEVNSDTDQAYRYYLQLFEKYPDDRYVRFNAGTFALFSNHIDRAVEIYSGADFDQMDFSINMDRRNMVFLFDALHQQGDFQKILALNDQYLHENPDYFYKMIAHMNLRNEEAAERLFRELDEVDSARLRLPKAYYFNILGREYLQLKQPNKANLCLQKSMTYASHKPGVINYERLYSLFYLGEFQKGIRELEQLLPVFAADSSGIQTGTILDFLAYFHAGAGDLEATAEYQNRRGQFPKQHFFHTTDAFISMKTGDKAAAVEYLKKAYRAGVIFEDISFGHNIDFLPLHGFPPFDEFVKPK